KWARDELQVRACREERLDNPRPDRVQVLGGLGDVEVATPFNVSLLPPATIELIPLQRFRVVLVEPRPGVSETSDKLFRARLAVEVCRKANRRVVYLHQWRIHQYTPLRLSTSSCISHLPVL